MNGYKLDFTRKTLVEFVQVIGKDIDTALAVWDILRYLNGTLTRSAVYLVEISFNNYTNALYTLSHYLEGEGIETIQLKNRILNPRSKNKRMIKNLRNKYLTDYVVRDDSSSVTLIFDYRTCRIYLMSLDSYLERQPKYIKNRLV